MSPTHTGSRKPGEERAPARTAPARLSLAWLALPLLAAVLVYFNALSGEFVYDDNDQIVKNPWVHELRYLPDVLSRPVWAYQTTEPTNYYRPIQMGLYNLLWTTFGADPLPFHVLNLLFHLLCTAGVFFLVKRVAGEAPPAAAAALLFAVHPLNTETVAWIACLPELTYAFFVLAALLLHLRAWSATGGRRAILRSLAVLAFILAMFSKETGAVLLPLVILLEIWVRPILDRERREGTAVAGDRSRSLPGAPGKPSWLRTGREALPYALAAAGYLAVRTLVIGGFAPRVRAGLTPFDAVLNAPILLLSYVRDLLLPLRLVAFHVLDRVPSVLDPRFLGGLLGVGLLGVALPVLARRRPDLAFAGALALLPFLPVLYIPAVGENAFAERYAYLPTAGAAWMAAGALEALLRRLRRRRDVAAALMTGAVILAIPCAARAVVRNEDWRDDFRITSATLRQEPRAWRMVVLKVNWCYRHDRFEEALETVEKGVAAFPDRPVLQVMAVNTRLLLNRIAPQDAIAALERIVAANPYYNEARYSLGGAYLRANRPGEAIRVLEKVVTRDSNDEEAINRLGVALAEAGRREEARATFERALKLDPAFGKARRNLERLDRHRGAAPGE